MKLSFLCVSTLYNGNGNVSNVSVHLIAELAFRVASPHIFAHCVFKCRNAQRPYIFAVFFVVGLPCNQRMPLLDIHLFEQRLFFWAFALFMLAGFCAGKCNALFKQLPVCELLSYMLRCCNCGFWPNNVRIVCPQLLRNVRFFPWRLPSAVAILSCHFLHGVRRNVSCHFLHGARRNGSETRLIYTQP